jgi:hypothetical protein
MSFLQAGTELVKVPSTVLITLDSPIVQDEPRLKSTVNNPGITVQGIIATALTLNMNESNGKGFYSEWRATWPTLKDFQEYMPLFWNTRAQKLLPSGTKGLNFTDIPLSSYTYHL